MKLKGIEAIEYAEANNLTLSKYTDPTEDAREGLTPAEARRVASEDPSLIWIEATEHIYTIRTDAVQAEISAISIDTAAKLFAADEFPGKQINDVDDLFARIEKIGDGAWCWIESETAPDGARREWR